MAETYSAGIVTAYGAAVRGGYTGTYEEFCAEQASFAENAEQVAQDREAMETLAAQFSGTTVPAAVQTVQNAGAAQIQAVEAASETEQQQIAAQGAGQETRVTQAGSDQVAAIQAAGTTQVENVNAAGTTQVGNVNTAGTTQVDAVQAKGQEVIDSIPEDFTDLQNEVGDLKSKLGKYEEVTPTSTITDKLFNFTDKSEMAMSGGLYRVYDLSSVSDTIKISGRNFNANYYPLYAFFDENEQILEHYTGTNYKNITDLEVAVPSGAKTVYVNGQDDSNISSPPVVKAVSLLDYASIVPELVEASRITINCFGDSTTDGAFVSGEHGAEYGKAPYPARLKTILTDNGYDINVINSGEAGERTPDTTIRVGGFPCVLTEDVTIPADNTPQPLGTNLSSSRGRVFGTTLQIPLTGRDGTDFCVYFTSTSLSKSPNVFMDGIELVVTRGASSPYPNYIAKKTADGKAVTIPAGTFLFTEDVRNEDINIVMTGINDQYALRMNDWLTMMQKCLAASKRCLIVSSWIPLFNAWYDMTGSTTAAKYTEFKNAVNPVLGVYHVDMYDLWYHHALEYALASGYLSDLTTAQKEAIQAKLDSHIIPAEFTYNNTEGEAHLNKIGYQVVAMIIYDRLKRLNFI